MMQALLKNIKMLKNSADLVYNTKDYTSATILYFKLLFAVLDYIILIKEGKTPKDHTERFKILKEKFNSFYVILDKDFSIYRNTYTLNIDKKDCDRIKNDTKRIIKEQGINV